MKKTSKQANFTFRALLLGASIALLGVWAFSLAACSNGSTDPSGTPGGTTGATHTGTYTVTKNSIVYTLTVSTPPAKAVHTVGENYILTVTSGSTEKTSSGKLAGVTDSTLSLQPSSKDAPVFTITVSSARITNITGAITFNDGSTEQGPGSLTTSGGGGGDTSTTPSTPGTPASTDLAALVAFKEWLNAQAPNTKDNPYTAALKLSSLSEDLRTILREAQNKYVNLDLSGSTFTSIEWRAFDGCTGLASLNIPDSVINIGQDAFYYCIGLTSVRFEGTIPSSGFSTSTWYSPFLGDLRAKFTRQIQPTARQERIQQPRLQA